MERQYIFSEELVNALKSVRGKEYEDLYTHLSKTGKASEEILKRMVISNEPLRILLNQYSINKEAIRDVIILHAYLHDLGKLDRDFQEEKNERGWDKPSSSPHALFSLPLAKSIIEDYLSKRYRDISERGKAVLTAFALLSIATHHTDYHRGLYESYRSDKPEYMGINREYGSPYAYDILENAWDTVNKIPDGEKETACGKRRIPRRRYVYSLFNGVLRLSDWLASGRLGIEKVFVSGIEEIQGSVEKSMRGKGWELRDYQGHIKGVSFDCGFLRLPTGDGKTETALLPNFGGINKVIYTLPTVTTVESMRHRFEDDYFGRDKVSFSHHLLFLSLHDDERLEERIYHKYNIKKVVATTIDRVLLALMNCRHYPLLEISLNNSYLIVDEIHSYSPFTLSLILNGLEYLKNYHNTRILVMSATLPKLIEEELVKRLGAREVLPADMVERRYSSKKRVQIRIRDDYLVKNGDVGDVSEIVKEFRKGKKILVVLNTVDRARAMYEKLKEAGLRYEKDIFLIHGRFSQEDKMDKMKLLEKLKGNGFKNKAFILVSTQVVEVSLNIDFDMMFTEVSPFDSLIQRCGRVNRYGEKAISDVYVFKVEKELPYKDFQLRATLGILEDFELESERDFLNANDEYYESVRGEYEKELEKTPLADFTDISRSFGEKLLRTRDSFMTLPVIPTGRNDEIYTHVKGILSKWSEMKDKEKIEAKVNILRNAIDLPIYKVKPWGDGDLYEKFGMSFVNADYSSEVGIIVKEKEALIW